MPRTVIDPHTFAELKENMGADFIGELIDTYFEETPQLMSDLQQALAADDCEAFRRIAHSIKASSAAFGALDLAALARELEMTGKAGDLNGAKPKVQQLVEDYQQVQHSLTELQHGF